MERLVLTPSEAAKALVTSPDKVRELIQSGELPAYRQGRNFKVPISLLEEYIANRAIKETEARRLEEGRKNGE